MSSVVGSAKNNILKIGRVIYASVTKVNARNENLKPITHQTTHNDASDRIIYESIGSVKNSASKK